MIFGETKQIKLLQHPSKKLQENSPGFRGFLIKAFDASTQELIGSFSNLPVHTQFFDGCSSKVSAVCHKGPSLFSTDLAFTYSYPSGTNVSFTAWVVIEVNASFIHCCIW
jgi:hypothetical protein